jgi:type IV secretion system protein VirB5
MSNFLKIVKGAMEKIKYPNAPERQLTDNPHLNARMFWNDYTRGILSDLRLSQCFSLICFMIALIAVSSAFHIASQSKFVPYIVEVDKLGQSVAVAPANEATPADPRVIHASLAAFIANARLVTPDIALQRKAIFSLYAMMKSDDPAVAKMTAWLNGDDANNPFHRAAKETVETEIVSVIPQSSDTWQIEWNEKIFDRQGTPSQLPYRMKALVTVSVSAPDASTPEDKVRQNPLGIYVKDFSWSKEN